jgi:molecular chaperone HtpG
MELKIPHKFKDILDQNSALSGLVNTSMSEFSEWLKRNDVRFFTEYTDHSLEHIESTLETANDLIRDECKAFITPHDVATLVLATLLHDCAMHLSEDGFINLVREDETTIINGFEDKSWKLLWADFLAESRRFSGRKLVALFGDAEPVRHPPLDEPQQLNGKDLLLCGEFLRRHHARLAHEIALFGVPGPTGRELKLPVTDDTFHVVDLAGLVARSHGLAIRDCFEYLQIHYSSVKMVRGIHPTFLMALLRIADILQIQSSRAPKQVQKVRQMKSPVSSGEWEMHQAIKDISPKEFPETLWVVAQPETVRAYLRIRDLLDQIQNELDLSWTVIGEVYGYDPEFREFGLKIRRIRSNVDDIDSFSKQVRYVPVKAAFEVADTDLLKLLIGPLYGEKAEIGIRELLQNAIDAVHELHEYVIVFKDQASNLPSHKEDVIISIDQNESGEWWLTISDYGIGMTINTVKEYFLKAGASLRRSEIWKKTFEDVDGKSKILRSGRFGIGALAAYLIGDEIKVTTRHISRQDGNGIEFVAQIDTESIEIKNINRDIGTTISIKMSKSATDVLIPFADENKHAIENKNLKWDWFCLETPIVSRRFRQVELKQNDVVPGLNAKLPLGWHRIKHSDFEDIQWSYMPYVPGLICNGIQVRQHEGQGRYGPKVSDKYVQFERPSLSVFDLNAAFPLNIQRTGITTPNLPFHRELLEDLIKDFIAFNLVEAPTNENPKETANEKYFESRYYGGFYDAIQSPSTYIPIKLPHWVSTKSGTGMFCDPGLFNKLGKKSVLVIFAYQNSVTPNIALSEDQIVLRINLPAHYSLIVPALNEISAFALGFSMESYTQTDFFALPLTNYGNTLRSSRVILNKRAILALENLREYSQPRYDFLQDLNDMAFPVFDSEEIAYEDFRLRKSKNAFRINKEWEDKNWMMLNAGECPKAEFAFDEFATIHLDADYTKWPCVIAEWYFDESNQQKENSVFMQVWDDLVQSYLIPYDVAERKAKLNRAFQELETYIENYQTTKDLIAAEMKRRAGDKEEE